MISSVDDKVVQLRGAGGELGFTLLHRMPSSSPSAPDLHVEVRASSTLFSAVTVRVWLEWPDVNAFLAELEELNHKLTGKAEVVAMAPSDFSLAIENLDAKGHMAVNFVVGRLVTTENGQFQSCVTGGFEVLPGDIESLHAWFKAVVAGESTAT